MTLFWRSFLLIALLIVTAVLASFQIYRVYEREPRSRELAQQTVSTINLTRAALVNADPFLRRELLIDLNEAEGLRIFPATASEKLEPLPDDPLLEKVVERVREALGGQTRFASERDGLEGFWVSFLIDQDEFWAVLPWERFEPSFGLQWLGWGAALLAIALAGAFLIASMIARPLAALELASGRLGRGQAHEPLAEKGPRELRGVSAAFNRMASDLERIERERAMVLAGISHDLRTPLSRLRLALELNPQASDREAMISDINEIDAVIGQFLEFARGANEEKSENELNEMLDELADHYRRIHRQVSFRPGRVPPFVFARMAVRRAVANLVDNALRYAGDPVEVETSSDGARVIVEVRDRGPGVPGDQIERVKQPFTRLDNARSGAGGAGLGLAIVERIARSHHGAVDLAPRPGGGLIVRLSLLR
ncbi:MAG: two-component system, OmpR family, osmolarity sensor histidine kinase EnvZ [Betaproteobacteria bacterium]|nr:two-component system, OmpR family, osmolarity sensor histidine kinase EnvZ [Betaproteobacteria bacterium]